VDFGSCEKEVWFVAAGNQDVVGFSVRGSRWPLAAGRSCLVNAVCEVMSWHQ